MHEAARRCDSLGMGNQAHELTDRYSALLARCRERDHRLEEMRLRLAQIYKSSESLRAWINDSIRALQALADLNGKYDVVVWLIYWARI